jgi:hypothetical protein
VSDASSSWTRARSPSQARPTSSTSGRGASSSPASWARRCCSTPPARRRRGAARAAARGQRRTAHRRKATARRSRSRSGPRLGHRVRGARASSRRSCRSRPYLGSTRELHLRNRARADLRRRWPRARDPATRRARGSPPARQGVAIVPATMASCFLTTPARTP